MENGLQIGMGHIELTKSCPETHIGSRLYGERGQYVESANNKKRRKKGRKKRKKRRHMYNSR
jgi:hypothetical protein